MDIINSNKKWINDTWEKIDKKMQKVAVRSRNKIPYTAIDGVHDDKAVTDICWWTNGFWGGLMWLLYIDTKNEEYKTTALNAEKIMDGALKDYYGLHHDVGFMWHISSGVNYRKFGDKESRVRAIYAANCLAARFNLKGGYITAWNGKTQQGWTIIDSMMNIPLLYWASEDSGDDRYASIAMAHADMAIRDHVREDGSVNHIVVHDHNTPEVIETLGGQGRCVGSCWSRGQAWALYGFILSYIHTGKKEYLDTAKKVANYFIAACCDDWLPRADFRAPDEPVVYDSTAACCAACGLIEIANNVDEFEKKTYLSAAMNILKAADDHFCNYDENTDYLVGYGTERYPNDENTPGVHIPIIYADYYFTEAIYKLRGNDFLAW